MKKLMLTAVLALFVSAAAQADGPAKPFHQNPGKRGLFFFKHPVPAFQAAPWYSYWPYTAHFQTPAPLMGAFYAPPYAGGGMVNPYFGVPTIPTAPLGSGN